MSSRLASLITAAALAIGAPLAHADALSYSWLEGGYVGTDVDGFDDAHGWRVGGSAAIGDRFHLFGHYAQQDLDVGPVDVDVDQWQFGLGFRHPLADRTDLVARLAYETADFGNAFDVEGASAELGVRSLLGARFEGWVFAGYFDAKQGGGDAYAKLGGQFRFTPRVGLVAEATFTDGDHTLFVGPRLSF